MAVLWAAFTKHIDIAENWMDLSSCLCVHSDDDRSYALAEDVPDHSSTAVLLSAAMITGSLMTRGLNKRRVA
jgi:hypothetical protein